MTSNKMLLLAAIAIATLTACGGGNGDNNDSNNVLIGTVLDGYIEGATVCLDSNSNGVCDPGEPSAKTGRNGQFKLAVGAASTAGLNLVVDIPKTAKDSDDNGKTLQEAGKSGYTMANTADQPSVITPLTTLVVGKVQTDALTVTAAKAQVLKELRLPSDTNLQDDHIKNPNTMVHNMARETAARLQKAHAAYEAMPANERPVNRLRTIADQLKKDDAAKQLSQSQSQSQSPPQSQPTAGDTGSLSCNGSGTTWDPELRQCVSASSRQEVILEVASQRQTCMGVIPMQCLMVRERVTGQPAPEMGPWFGNIEGFTHVPGKLYTLRVRKDRVSPPIADGSDTTYTLLAILN